MKEYTIFDVAKWFLSKENTMSHKKLQKLCWYAYSWDRFINYNLEKNELDKTFIQNNKVEAWVHGAVFPELYSDIRYSYKSKVESADANINEEFEKFLEKIYEIYGKYTGEELESINHQEKPWINARNGIGIFEKCTEELKLKDIIEEYKSRYV